MSTTRLYSTPILIIDDEPLFVTFFKDILKDGGYTEVYSSTDPRRVPQLLTQYNPKLLLCDIRMPHKDGIEVLTEAKHTHPTMAIIMISGVDDVQTAVSCLKQGASDYLLKPTTADNLLNAVETVLTTSLLHNKPPVAFKQTLRVLTDNHILETIDLCNGNISKSARKLGMSRQGVYARLKKIRNRDQ